MNGGIIKQQPRVLHAHTLCFQLTRTSGAGHGVEHSRPRSVPLHSMGFSQLCCFGSKTCMSRLLEEGGQHGRRVLLINQ